MLLYPRYYAIMVDNIENGVPPDSVDGDSETPSTETSS